MTPKVALAWTAFAASLSCSACAPGDGVRFHVINMEQPSDDIALRPPADYEPCYLGEARAYDNDDAGSHAQRMSVVS